MSATLKIKCTCGLLLEVAAKFAGKRARCTGCKSIFNIPRPTQSAPRKSRPTKARPTQLPPAKSTSNRGSTAPRQLVDSASSLVSRPMLGADLQLSPGHELTHAKRESPCPSCSKHMGAGTIVCIYCGYHTRLRKHLETFKTAASKSAAASQTGLAANWAALCMYLSAIAFVTIASFLQRGIDGPTFLAIFFACYCAVAVLTIVLRKVWCDVDTFNHAAMVALVGMGGIRIIDSVVFGRFKFMFLLLGIVVSIGVFLIPKTSNEEHDTPFRNANGGIAIVPFLMLFMVGGVIMGGVFFIPQVGEIVAKLGGIMSAGLGMLIFGAWAKLTGRELGSSGWGNGHSSGCSSCGSSCGGGCGGGCGGCGG